MAGSAINLGGMLSQMAHATGTQGQTIGQGLFGPMNRMNEQNRLEQMRIDAEERAVQRAEAERQAQLARQKANMSSYMEGFKGYTEAMQAGDVAGAQTAAQMLMQKAQENGDESAFQRAQQMLQSAQGGVAAQHRAALDMQNAQALLVSRQKQMTRAEEMDRIASHERAATNAAYNAELGAEPPSSIRTAEGKKAWTDTMASRVALHNNVMLKSKGNHKMHDEESVNSLVKGNHWEAYKNKAAIEGNKAANEWLERVALAEHSAGLRPSKDSTLKTPTSVQMDQVEGLFTDLWDDAGFAYMSKDASASEITKAATAWANGMSIQEVISAIGTDGKLGPQVDEFLKSKDPEYKSLEELMEIAGV